METPGIQVGDNCSDFIWNEHGASDTGNANSTIQMRDLSYILKLEHAYYLWASNQEDYAKINIVLNKRTDMNITWQEFIAASKFDKPETIKKLGECIINQQIHTFAHVVRADQQDPMKQMTVTPSLDISGVHLRRVGRPRIPWIRANCKWLYKKDHEGSVYDHD